MLLEGSGVSQLKSRFTLNFFHIFRELLSEAASLTLNWNENLISLRFGRAGRFINTKSLDDGRFNNTKSLDDGRFINATSFDDGRFINAKSRDTGRFKNTKSLDDGRFINATSLDFATSRNDTIYTYRVYQKFLTEQDYEETSFLAQLESFLNEVSVFIAFGSDLLMEDDQAQM